MVLRYAQELCSLGHSDPVPAVAEQPVGHVTSAGRPINQRREAAWDVSHASILTDRFSLHTPVTVIAAGSAADAATTESSRSRRAHGPGAWLTMSASTRQPLGLRAARRCGRRRFGSSRFRWG